MAAILKMPTYYAQVQLDTRYEKIITNYARKSIFGGDDVIDDVTGWPQSSPSVFPYKWRMNIFRDHWETNNDINNKFGTKSHPYTHLGLIQNPIYFQNRQANILVTGKFWQVRNLRLPFHLKRFCLRYQCFPLSNTETVYLITKHYIFGTCVNDTLSH